MKYLIKSSLVICLLFLCLVLLITAVVGAEDSNTGVEIENPLQWNSFAELLDAIINFLFYLAVGIAPIMIIVAGFYFVTAAGNPDKIETAKKIVLWALIGLLVVMSAKGLIALFGRIFGVQTLYQ
jgi:hypothetical protein